MNHHVDGYDLREVPAGHIATCTVCGDTTIIRGGIQSSEQIRPLVAHREKHWRAKREREEAARG